MLHKSTKKCCANLLNYGKILNMKRFIFKRLQIGILFLSLIFLFLFIGYGCANDHTFVLTYSSSLGGNVLGVVKQFVRGGGDGQTVRAVANQGYEFKCWSDGCKTAERNEQNVWSSINFVAEFVLVEYNFTYIPSEGGHISGLSEQTVQKDFFGQAVKAVPNKGYYFLGWNDGIDSDLRVDKGQGDLSVTAIFKRREYDVEYISTNGGYIEGTLQQKVCYGEKTDSVTAVAQAGYEFVCWSDGLTTKKRCDTIKQQTTLRAIFAKKDAVRFSILMPFITEVHAELELANGDSFQADYVMTETEKKVCDLTVMKVKGLLNEIFAGEVVFDIDTYYTEFPIGRENFYRTIDMGGKYSYGINAREIPEIKEIASYYRCVIATFCLSDEERVAISEAGAARRKGAYIHAESTYWDLYRQKSTPEFLLDDSDPDVSIWWESILGTYLHEFVHTAELVYNYSDYAIPLDLHGVLYFYNKQGVFGIRPVVLYLLGEADVNGELIGIPKDYWGEDPDLWIWN